MTSSDDALLSDAEESSDSDNDFDLSDLSDDEDDFKQPAAKVAKVTAKPKPKPKAASVPARPTMTKAPPALKSASTNAQAAAPAKPAQVPATVMKSAKPIAQGTAVKSTKPAPAVTSQPASNISVTGIPPYNVTTQDQAQEWCQKYLEAQNQPFNAQLLTDNMRGRIRKPVVERALSQLALDQSINEKVFGKAKLYWANQERFGDVAPSKIDQLKKQQVTLESEDATVNARVREVKQGIEAASKELSNEELDAQLAKYESQVADKQARLAAVKSAAVVVTAADIDKAQKQYKKMRTEWRKRKRIVKEALEIITTDHPKFPTPAKMAEEMGIENDEDWGVVIGPDLPCV